jgi:hypothetical protein
MTRSSSLPPTRLMRARRVCMVDVFSLGRHVLARAFLADVVEICPSGYPAQITDEIAVGGTKY